MSNSILPLISVIITTKNEEKNIKNCLDSIKSQNYPKELIEIILVDNNSTDSTVRIAKQYTKNIYIFGPERSAQRNFGIKKCRGSYFLQLDADQCLSNNVLYECAEKVRNFKNNLQKNGSYSEIALQIPENIVGSSNYFNKIRNYEKNFYTNTVIDCVRFIPIKTIQLIGGYDSQLNGPEDWDLDQRIRKECLIDIVHSTMDHNEGNMTFLNFLKKKWYYSQSFGTYINKWGKDNEYVRKRLGFYYRYIKVFVENKKYKHVINHPLLFTILLSTKLVLGGLFFSRKIIDNLKHQ